MTQEAISTGRDRDLDEFGKTMLRRDPCEQDASSGRESCHARRARGKTCQGNTRGRAKKKQGAAARSNQQLGPDRAGLAQDRCRLSPCVVGSNGRVGPNYDRTADGSRRARDGAPPASAATRADGRSPCECGGAQELGGGSPSRPAVECRERRGHQREDQPSTRPSNVSRRYP